MCCIITKGVPQFLRGKGTGWLTAEYALLPTSTTTRTQRESITSVKMVDQWKLLVLLADVFVRC